MAEPNKDNIYVDVDDEITAIIDKVTASKAKIVALVLPKRASVLQSVVNMKLLKRNADDAGKKLVLITSEQGLLPLAGSVGVFVASSLQSKPEVPSAPNEDEADDDVDEDALSLDDTPQDEFSAESSADRPVGDLAAGAGLAASESDLAASQAKPDRPSAGAGAAGAAAGQAARSAGTPKTPKNKKLKVPSFTKFRKRLLLIIGLIILLAIGVWLLFFKLPKATIAITTNGRDVNSSLAVTMDTGADEANPETGTVPATVVQQQKTYSQQVDATGKENKGDTASGSIKMAICYTDFGGPNNVPSGTGVSTAGKTYITQDTANFQWTGNTCSGGNGNLFQSDSVGIMATDPGEEYNVDNADFSVAGRPDVTATGSAQGGTDDIQQVVTQADIDKAKGQINKDDNAVRQNLAQQLKGQNLFPVLATFRAAEPNVTTSAQPGDEVSSVTVTETIDYSMFGTNRSNLVALIKHDINVQVGSGHQGILSDGLDNASFSVKNISDNSAELNMESTASVGPNINKTDLKRMIAGQKSGQVRDEIRNIPGVSDVQIHMRPFWLSAIPNDPSKIEIKIGKANND